MWAYSFHFYILASEMIGKFKKSLTRIFAIQLEELIALGGEAETRVAQVIQLSP